MIQKDKDFLKIKSNILKQKKAIKELSSLFNHLDNVESKEEKKMVLLQIKSLKRFVKKANEEVGNILIEMSLPNSPKKIEKKVVTPVEVSSDTLAPPGTSTAKGKKKKTQLIFNSFGEKINKLHIKKIIPSRLEKETIKRLKIKEKEIKLEKIKKANPYVKISNKFFSKSSTSLLNKGLFANIERDLIKSNLEFLPKSYVSVVLFSTLLSVIFAGIIFIFLLFFNVSLQPWFFSLVEEDILTRILKVFWLLFVMPIATFLIGYSYPSMERQHLENRIDQELPFAVINMSAISGSMVEPSKIFNIMILTKEYPFLEKEFIKLINEINILGYDLVTALKNNALNSPSKKLAELYNGLATTIDSGGNLPDFFDKRSQTLLFDYKIERQKQTRASETFMDIYISVVIAAPMILMLLLMMIKISGLGLSISATMITVVMTLGVTTINVVFLTFLHLKQPKG